MTKVESDSVQTKIRKTRNRYHPFNEFEDESKFEFVGNAQECTALYVECEPHSNAAKPYHENQPDDNDSQKPTKPSKPFIPTNIFHGPKPSPKKPTIQPNKKPSVVANGNDTKVPSKPITTGDHHWPWSADIYVNGKLVCIGVLLDNTCVVTELTCMELVNLQFDYVTVVVGKSQAFMNVIGPYEQILRVSCFVKMDGSNSVLLFLEQPARFNRECLPTYLPET